MAWFAKGFLLLLALAWGAVSRAGQAVERYFHLGRDDPPET